MKKILTITLVMVAVLALGTIGVAQALDITINDNMRHDPGGGGPPSPYAFKPANEDNTVTYGAMTGQVWDMEAFYYNGAGKLELVGGWNWKTGVSGYTYKTGDIFIDIPTYNAPFGQLSGPVPPALSTANDYWQYNYVIHFTRDGSGNLTGTYDIYRITETTNVQVINVTAGGPDEALDYASPFALNLATSTVVTDSTLNGAYKLNANPLTFSWVDPATINTDAKAKALGYDVTGGQHYVLDVDLKPIADYLTDGDVAALYFRSHITMTCGNDMMLGQYDPSTGLVPVPGSVLLLGTGLVGLAALRGRMGF